VREEPRNLEAEQCVLGSCILSTKASAKAIATLKPTDFWLPQHQVIFAVITGIIAQGREVDFVTVRNALGDHLQDAGGLDYLMQVAEYVPSASNIGTYADIVRDKSTRRAIIKSAKDVVNQAFDEDIATSDLVTTYGRTVSGLQSGIVRQPMMSIGDAMREWDDQLLSDTPTRLYTTGFPSLDKMCGGFGAGDQVIVGAYSGMGKTAFGFESIMLSSKKTNKPWVIFSLEMNANQLVSRFVQSRTGIGINRQRQREFTDQDYTLMSGYLEEFYKLPIYIVDSGQVTPSIIRARLMEVVEKHGDVAGFMIDYLGMAVKTTNSQQRASAVEQYCFDTKGLAKEFNCTSLILSQLARDSVRSETRTPEAPSLYHLKESGGIEASADIVLGLHRPEYWEAKRDGRKEHKAPAYVHVLKQRYGATGVVDLEFTPWQARWHEQS
jgi:replicative DNA helicase